MRNHLENQWGVQMTPPPPPTWVNLVVRGLRTFSLSPNIRISFKKMSVQHLVNRSTQNMRFKLICKLENFQISVTYSIIRSRIARAKNVFSSRKELLTKSFSLDLKKRIIKTVIWSTHTAMLYMTPSRGH